MISANSEILDKNTKLNLELKLQPKTKNEYLCHMQLSVVILNYNVCYFLEQCVLSVQKSLKNIDSEIIVVDNASSDRSCQMIKERFKEVLLIENKENTGFPKGNNIGVSRAKGKYICILNPDTVVAEDTFCKLLEFANNRKNLGVVGCKLIDGTGNFLPESKRNIPTPKVSLLKLLGRDKYYYANHLSENQSGKASVFVGAFMFMERQKYLDLKGFDEDFFMYGEDIDLCYRAEKLGFENYYFADTAIIHYKGESTFKDKIYFERFYEAMKIFYKKHFKTNFLIDFLTNVAIKCFLIFNSFWKKSNVKQIPESYIFISEDDDFRLVLEQKLLKNVSLLKNHKAHNFNLLKKDSIEIIFDNNFVTNKEIIAFIQKNKNRNFTFKIRPRTTNFLIGSNSKDEKGEVII